MKTNFVTSPCVILSETKDPGLFHEAKTWVLRVAQDDRLFLYVWFVVLVSSLIACTPLQNIPPHTPTQTFGPWNVSQCTISTRAADVWVITTGSLTFGGELEFQAQFTPPLVRPPFATISGRPIPVRIEGANRTYNLFIPYNPENGAHFLQTGSFITLTYQPLGRTDLQDVSFPTAPLMQALGAIAGCP